MSEQATLSQFLLSRIAEDEFDGRYATMWEWCDAVAAELTTGSDDKSVVLAIRSRVVAEVEAKRQIVAEGGSTCSAYGDPLNAEIADSLKMPEWLHYPDPDWTGHCDGCSAAESADREHIRVLRILASVYADHEDYSDAWRLDA